MAARFPEAGGGYVYLREAYGRPIAFLYGWMALLVMDPGLTAALAVGLASYVGYIFKLSPAGVKVVAIGSIVFVALVNIRGVRLGGWLIRWLTILKLGLLGLRDHLGLWVTGGTLVQLPAAGGPTTRISSPYWVRWQAALLGRFSHSEAGGI